MGVLRLGWFAFKVRKKTTQTLQQQALEHRHSCAKEGKNIIPSPFFKNMQLFTTCRSYIYHMWSTGKGEHVLSQVLVLPNCCGYQFLFTTFCFVFV